MFISIFGSIESGILYAIMALGVYLSFRILDFPDLTVDGSFVTGAAVSAVLIVNGTSPVMATFAALITGFIAGSMTGLLHTKGKINPLLAGILMQIALYSINLRIMGTSNIPLFNEMTMLDRVASFWQSLKIDEWINHLFASIGVTNLPQTWAIVIFGVILTFVVKLFIDVFLKTEIGLAIRATGDNKKMIRSLSANTDRLTVLGLALSNALVALSGALIAQNGGFADAQMGIGMIVIGLASVIIGEALFGTKTIARTTLAVIGGSIIYRIVVTFALRVDFLDASDMKLITAVIVIIALVTPKIIETQREKNRRLKKRQQLAEVATLRKGGQTNVAP